MAKQIKMSLQVNADITQAKRAMQELQNSLTKVGAGASIGNSMTEELQKSSQLVAQLQVQLKNAFNTDTGKLDFTKFNQQMKQSGVQLQDYARALSSLGPAGTEAFVQLSRQIAASELPLIRVSDKVKELGTAIANTARWQLSSSAIHSFMGAIQGAISYTEQLNKSLTDIRIVTGYSADKMADFAIKANDAAKALSSTTKAYTEASLIYFQQGLSDEEVEARTNTTIKMAHAAGESASEVSSYMTAIWNNFADGADNLEYYADVITKLGAATAASSAEIAGGLEKFAAVADTVGLSYEYAAAAVTTIVDKTRQSEDVVGTSLKTIFARLEGLQLGETLEDGTDLNKYSKALLTVGVNIKDANGELKTMDEIIDELGVRWKTLAKDEQVALAQTVGGMRQYNQFIALMDFYDDLKDNIDLATNSMGTLNEQQQIYAEGLEGAQNRLQAAKEDIYADLLDDEGLVDLTDALTTFLKGIDALLEGLGGIKGILPQVIPLMTALFSDKIATSAVDFATSIGNVFKGTDKLKEDRTNKLKAALKEVGASSQQTEALERTLAVEDAYLEKVNQVTGIEKQKLEYLHAQALEAEDLYQTALKEETVAKNIATVEKRQAISAISRKYGVESSVAREYVTSYLDAENKLSAINVLEEPEYSQDDYINQIKNNIQDLANIYAEGKNNSRTFIKSFGISEGEQEEFRKNFINLKQIFTGQREATQEEIQEYYGFLIDSLKIGTEKASQEAKEKFNKLIIEGTIEPLKENIKKAIEEKNITTDIDLNNLFSDLSPENIQQSLNNLDQKIKEELLAKGVDEETATSVTKHVIKTVKKGVDDAKVAVSNAGKDIPPELEKGIQAATNAATASVYTQDKREGANKTRQNLENSNKDNKDPISITDKINATTRAISGLTMAYSSMNNIMNNIFNDIDKGSISLSTILGSLTSIGMTLPSIISSMQAINALTKGAIGFGTMGWIAGIAAVIGLVVSSIENLERQEKELAEQEREFIKSQQEKTKAILEENEAILENIDLYVLAKSKYEDGIETKETFREQILETAKALEIENAELLAQAGYYDLLQEKIEKQRRQSILEQGKQAQEATDEANRLIVNQAMSMDLGSSAAEFRGTYKSSDTDVDKLNQIVKQLNLEGISTYSIAGTNGSNIKTRLEFNVTELSPEDWQEIYEAARADEFFKDYISSMFEGGWDSFEQYINETSSNRSRIIQSEVLQQFIDEEPLKNVEDVEDFYSAVVKAAEDASGLKYGDKGFDEYFDYALKEGSITSPELYAQYAQVQALAEQAGMDYSDLTEHQVELTLNLIDQQQKAYDSLSADNIPIQIQKAQDFFDSLKFGAEFTLEKLKEIGVADESGVIKEEYADEFTMVGGQPVYIGSDIQDFRNRYISNQMEEYQSAVAARDVDFSDVEYYRNLYQNTLTEASLRPNGAVSEQTQQLYDYYNTLYNTYTQQDQDYSEIWKGLTVDELDDFIDTEEEAEHYVENLTTAVINSAEAEDLNAEAIQRTSNYLQENNEYLKDNKEWSDRVAYANIRMNDGLSDLSSNFDKWQEGLADTKDVEHYSEAINGIGQDLQKMFNISEMPDEDFIIKHLNDIELAATGDEEAIQRLQTSYAELQLLEALNISSTEDLRGAGQDLYNILVLLDTSDFSAGMDMFMNDEQLRKDFENAVNEAELTADQIRALLDIKGFSIDVSGSKGNITVGDSYFAGRFNTKDLSKKKSGSGGGSRSKKDLKDYDDEFERYYVITREIKDQEDAFNRLNKAKDRAFGKSKLDLIEKEADALERELDLQKEYLREITDYYQKDQAQMNALGATYDENGVVSNYDEIIKREVDAYNAAVDKYNAGGSEADFGTAENRWKWVQDTIKQYDETNQLYQEALDKVTDLENQIHDLKLEKITSELELRVSLNEADLAVIEQRIKMLEDNEFSVSLTLKTKFEELDPYQQNVKYYQDAINKILQSHNINNLSDIAGMSAEQLAAAGFTANDISTIQSYGKELFSLQDTIRDIAKEIYLGPIAAMEQWEKKFVDLENKIKHTQNVINKYLDISKIVDGYVSGVDETFITALSKANYEAALDILDADNKKYQADKEAYDKLLKQRTDGAKALSEQELEYLNQDIEAAEKQMNESRERMLDAEKNAIDLEKAYFVQSMTEARATVNQNIYKSSADYSNTIFEQDEKLRKSSMDSYAKIYELSKITKDIDKLTNSTLKGNEKLLALKNRINDVLKNNKTLTEEQLTLLQREFDLEKARADWEDARNSKTTVRMTMDSEGGYGYTYTAGDNSANADNFAEKYRAWELETYNQYYDILEQIQKYSQDYEDQVDKILQKDEPMEDRIKEIQHLAETSEPQLRQLFQRLAELEGDAARVEAEYRPRYFDAIGYTPTGDESGVVSDLRENLGKLFGTADPESTLALIMSNLLGYGQTGIAGMQTLGANIGTTLGKDTTYAQGFTSGALGEVGEGLSNATNMLKPGGDFDKAVGNLQIELKTTTDLFNQLVTKGLEGLDENILSNVESINKLCRALGELNLTAANAQQQMPSTSQVGTPTYSPGIASGSGSGSGSVSIPDGINETISNNQITQNGFEQKTQNILERWASSNTADFGKYGKISYNQLIDKVLDDRSWADLTDGVLNNPAMKLTNSKANDAANKLLKIGKNKNNLLGYMYSNADFIESLMILIRDHSIKNHGLNVKLKSGEYQQITTMSRFDTGGYTGAWNSSAGRLAVLHEKELVLNKQDTEYMLNMVQMARDAMKQISMPEIARFNGNLALSSSSGDFQQTVNINADFSGVTNHLEIEAAFNSLVNQAAQFANRKI